MCQGREDLRSHGSAQLMRIVSSGMAQGRATAVNQALMSAFSCWVSGFLIIASPSGLAPLVVEIILLDSRSLSFVSLCVCLWHLAVPLCESTMMS